MLDIERIQSSGVAAGVEHHVEISSTNDRAVELAGVRELELPLLIFADRQTAGRGRGLNRWWSAEGSLTFSLLLEGLATGLSTAQWPQFSLTAGLAVCDALQPYAPQQLWGVKWPNDVFVGPPERLRKICGILIESPSVGQGRLVIGIGINVNNSFAAAPLDVRERAASLADVAGRTFDATDIAIQVIRSLQRRWNILGQLGFAALADEWRQHCILQGRMVTLEQGYERTSGQCLGIDEEGALILQMPTERRRFHSGTILRFE